MMNSQALKNYIEQNRENANELIREVRYAFIQQDFQELGESDVLQLYLEGKGAYAVPEKLTEIQIFEELTDAMKVLKSNQSSNEVMKNMFESLGES